MIKKMILAAFSIVCLIVIILITRTFLLSPLHEDKDHATDIKITKVDTDKAAKNLSKAIQFETISTRDDNKTNAESFKGLHGFLHEAYADVFSKLEVKEFPPFGILLKWQGKDTQLKPIMFMAHQDVVPIAPGTLEKWDHPPFSGQIDKGYIFGRGSFDDKGSLISILEATSNLIRAGYVPERTIYILSTDTEEIGGQTAISVAKYFQENNIKLEAVFDEGGFILKNKFSQVSNPVALVGISEKGYLDLELFTTSKGGHSSMPEPQSTVGILSKAISRLEENQFPAHITGIQQEMFENIGRYMSFKDRLFVANLWLFRPLLDWQLSKNPATSASIRTTTAATMFNAGVKSNVLPAEAKATLNFRIIPGETIASVVERVKQTIADPRVTITTLQNNEPSSISSHSNKVFATIKKGINALYPDKETIITPYVLVAATDSRHFVGVSENQYKFLSCLVDNDELSGFHGYNEKLSVDNLEKMIQFYIIMMQELS